MIRSERFKSTFPLSIVRGQFFETTMRLNSTDDRFFDTIDHQPKLDKIEKNLHDGHFHTGSPLQLLSSSCVQEFGKKEHASIMRLIADHSSSWPAFRLTTPLAHSGHVRLRQYYNLHVHRLELNIPLYFTWNSCIYEAIEWWGGGGGALRAHIGIIIIIITGYW